MNSDGSPDTSFNQTGTGLDEGVRALAVKPDGKIVVAGEFTSMTAYRHRT